jgi:hypothetical protein
MTDYGWQKSYQAAVLESDWTKLEERVEAAESEIHKRRLILAQDHGGTEQERKALVNALQSLRILRKDAALGSEKQKLGGVAQSENGQSSADS